MEPNTSLAAIDALKDELKRVNDLLFQDQTSSIIQYLVAVLGAAAVSAFKAPVAFVAVPLIANLWLLHMMVKNITSVKLAAYGRHLEEQINKHLGSHVFRYQLAVSQRMSKGRPQAFNAFFAYFVLGNVTLWAIGLVILARHQLWIYLALAVLVCLTSWFSAARTVAGRKDLYDWVTKQLADSEPDIPTPDQT